MCAQRTILRAAPGFFRATTFQAFAGLRRASILNRNARPARAAILLPSAAVQ